MMKNNTQLHSHNLKKLLLFFIFFLVFPALVLGDCTCDSRGENDGGGGNKDRALKYKLMAIASILIAGSVGVCLPILGKAFPALRPERDVFFVIKAFAAGVILSTGFVHILPDAFDHLTSPCLPRTPWADFPLTGLVAMLAAIGTLMVDTFATCYYEKVHFADRGREVLGEEEEEEEREGHVHVHKQATHGSTALTSPDVLEIGAIRLLRHRIISQV